jgi:hypothetical protein
VLQPGGLHDHREAKGTQHQQRERPETAQIGNLEPHALYDHSVGVRRIAPQHEAGECCQHAPDQDQPGQLGALKYSQRRSCLNVHNSVACFPDVVSHSGFPRSTDRAVFHSEADVGLVVTDVPKVPIWKAVDFNVLR